MQQFVKDKILFGFENQIIAHINGWDSDNKLYTFVRYFITCNAVKESGAEKKVFRKFNEALNYFTRNIDQTLRNAEITLWTDEVIPLHHINFLEEKDILNLGKGEPK